MRVLVADDSPTQRKIVTLMLKQIGFPDTAEAEDGQQALEMLQTQGPFDLLLTDWNMPNMSGLDLVQAIRADGAYAKLRILMVTTRNVKQDVIAAMRAGVNNYITKPFTPPILKEKISKVLT